MSTPGRISSIKVTAPAIFPVVPLYIRVIIHPLKGAQTTSPNSPTKGITKHTTHITPNTILIDSSL